MFEKVLNSTTDRVDASRWILNRSGCKQKKRDSGMNTTLCGGVSVTSCFMLYRSRKYDIELTYLPFIFVPISSPVKVGYLTDVLQAKFVELQGISYHSGHL